MKAVVSRLGAKGDGVITVEGKSYHISKVLPQELVELDDGRLRAVLEPSAERVQPFCPHFATCGGCKFQHWAEAPYQAWKRNLLVEALAAQDLTPNVLPMIDAQGEGRRRVSLHVRQQDGAWVAGFMGQKSHDLVALQQCPVLVPSLRFAHALAAAFGPALGNCDVAITAADNGLDVGVKAERKIVLRRLSALNEIMQAHKILRLSVNGEVHTARATPVIQMGKAQVELPLGSFLQATAEGEKQLASRVSAALSRSKKVADLFCGIGPFALRLAETARVFAADSDKPAIESLQTAVRKTQGIKPVEAQRRDLFREPLLSMELNQFDAVVLDPPRAGAEAQCRQLAKSNVPKVVMVACDVQSFARDAALLMAGGYSAKSVTPVDQFKWTPHLELVGEFSR